MSSKACPFCGETILAVAIKCKHCKANLQAAGGIAAPRPTSAGPAPLPLAEAAQQSALAPSVPRAVTAAPAPSVPRAVDAAPVPAAVVGNERKLSPALVVVVLVAGLSAGAGAMWAWLDAASLRGDPLVVKAREARLDACSDHTLREIVEGYFGRPHWTSETTEGGLATVTVRGGVKREGRPIQAALTFRAEGGGASFHVASLTTEGKVVHSEDAAEAFFDRMCAAASSAGREAKHD